MYVPTLGPSLKILSIVDISPYSAAVVNLLTHIAWPADTSCHLLVMVPGDLPRMDPDPDILNQVDETVEIMRWRDWAAAKILAEQVAADLQANNFVVETEICEKQSVDMLLERTLGLSVDLMVASAQWLNRPDGSQLGSTVQELVRQTHCSILVTRPSAQIRPLNTILAVGTSLGSRQIINFLKMLSLSEWAKVTVVSVVEEEIGVLVGTGFADKSLRSSIGQVQHGNVEVCAFNVIEHLHNFGVQAWSLIRYGDPAEQILTVAHEQDADLIVVGTGGQTRSQPPYLGSVAQKIVNYAPCSVLAVR